MPKKEKKKKVKYYFYNAGGSADNYTSLFTCVVSEIAFPRRKKGDCISEELRHNRIKVGDVVDIAFGDPKYLSRCELISKNANDCLNYLEPMWKFKYKRKFFWANGYTGMKVIKVHKK